MFALRECSGYPGQGGCFYGHEGRCYVSHYRVVFVSDTLGYTAYRSFSLPFYCIRDWRFHVSIFGTWACNSSSVQSMMST